MILKKIGSATRVYYIYIFIYIYKQRVVKYNYYTTKRKNENVLSAHASRRYCFVHVWCVRKIYLLDFSFRFENVATHKHAHNTYVPLREISLQITVLRSNTIPRLKEIQRKIR